MQVPTSQLLKEYLVNTRDSSEDNKTIGKQRMDFHYTELVSATGNHLVERTKYGNMKGTQRSYLLPIDYIPNGLKLIRVFINDRWIPLVPTISLENWSYIVDSVQLNTEVYTFTLKNEQGRMYIMFDPIPVDDASENIEITYLGYQDPLYFPDDVSVGKVSVRYDSADLLGSGSAFTKQMEGRFIRVNGGKEWIELVRYGSPTLFSMLHNWSFSDETDVSYVISEMPRLPHEFHYAIMYGAVADYYRPKDTEKCKQYENLYAIATVKISSNYKNKTQGSVTPGIQVSNTLRSVPFNYPTKLVTKLS